MLYRLHTNIFILSLLAIGFLAVIMSDTAFCLMTFCTVVALVTQICLLLFFSREGEITYTDSTLFWTTFFYDLLLGVVFMLVSYYYEGDTFLFSKSDAMFYYENSMKAVEKGFFPTAKYYIENEPFDDWGALLFDSMLMCIVPDKLFLNAVNMLTGSLSTLMLFRIGKSYMADAYAFLGALSYGTSSFIVFFNCTFLKESTFAFLIVCTFYYFNKVIAGDRTTAVIGVCINIAIIVFFRPAVAAMIVAAILTYYAVIKRGHAISLFLYSGASVIFVGSTKFMMDTFDHHSGGSMDKMIELGSQDNTYSGGFNYFVSIFAAFCGPFPTLFPKTEGFPITLNFYGAGLTLRQFLVIPLWLGVLYAIKRGTHGLLPLLVFVLFELIATGIMMASLELRKVMPHIPLMYIFMFYGLYQWQVSGKSERYLRVVTALFALGILFLWVAGRE